MKTSVFCALAAACILSADAIGQDYSEENYNTATNWVSRGGGTAGRQNYYLGRMDYEKVRAGNLVWGMRVLVYDFNTATPDTFRGVIHNETTTSSDMPFEKPALATGVLPLTNGEIAISFAKPFAPPAEKDLWVGVCFTSGGAASDGGYIRILRGDDAAAADTAGNTDLPGAGIKNSGNSTADSHYAFGQEDEYGNWTPGRSSLARTIGAELGYKDGQAPHGIVVAKTAQVAQGQRTQAGNSGYYPDVNGKNTGRADDIGFRVYGAVAANKAVIFCASLKWLDKPIPLQGGSPFYLDFAPLLILGAVTADAQGVAELMIPNAVAKGLSGSLYWQAVVVDGLNLWGTEARRQRFSQ